MGDPVFDKQEQFDRIAEGVLPGEQILCVYDAIGAGTGFIGVTDRRVIIQDNSFVGRRTALTSVPYTHVNAVSFVADKSILGRFASSSTIALSAGGKTYEVQFRGDEKAKHVHDAVLGRMLGLA